MHRRRGVTRMVEEVRRRIADRRWILIEDRPPGARARRVDDAVRRRMLHHLVERGAQWFSRIEPSTRRQSPEEPGLRQSPFALDRGGRDLERVGRFVNVEPREES